MPVHFRTTISPVITLYAPPSTSVNRPFRRVLPPPIILPFARVEHPPAPCRYSRPALPSAGISRKTLHSPSSARFPDQHVENAPNSPPQRANLPSPLLSFCHLSHAALGEAHRPLRSSCRSRLRRSPNQIRSVPRDE